MTVIDFETDELFPFELYWFKSRDIKIERSIRFSRMNTFQIAPHNKNIKITSSYKYSKPE